MIVCFVDIGGTGDDPCCKLSFHNFVDSSFDKGPYKDSTGIDLEEFIHKTLNKTQKDRSMLLKLETDINNFINEPK